MKKRWISVLAVFAIIFSVSMSSSTGAMEIESRDKVEIGG